VLQGTTAVLESRVEPATSNTVAEAEPLAPGATRSPNILALSSIRFFLAYLVVILHFNEIVEVSSIASSVPPSVVFEFFCLSGFILTYQYRSFASTEQALRFWVSRVARIFPVYWFCIALALAIIPLNTFARDGKQFLQILLPNLFLLQAWFPNPQIYYGFVGPGYTLSIEIFMYALFPVTIVWLSKHRQTRLTCALLFSILILFLCLSQNQSSFYIWVIPFVHMFEFLMGVTAALLFDRLSAVLRKLSYGQVSTIEITLLAAVMISSMLGSDLIQRTAGIILFASFVSVLAFEGGLLARAFSLPVLVYLGGCSYALYLLHSVYIQSILLNRIDIAQFGKVPAFLGFSLFAIVTSFLVCLWIEYPLRARIKDWGNRLVDRFYGKQPSRTAPPGSVRNTMCISLSLLVVLSCCFNGFARLVLDQAIAWSRSPVASPQNILYDGSAKLTKLYAWRCGKDLEIFTCWRPDKHPEHAPNIGIHILDKQGKIIGQLDHRFFPPAGIMQLPWRDYFTIPSSYLAKAEEVGIVLYDDPKQTLLIEGGPCDWGNHRLLFKLPSHLHNVMPLQAVTNAERR